MSEARKRAILARIEAAADAGAPLLTRQIAAAEGVVRSRAFSLVTEMRRAGWLAVERRRGRHRFVLPDGRSTAWASPYGDRLDRLLDAARRELARAADAGEGVSYPLLEKALGIESVGSVGDVMKRLRAEGFVRCETDGMSSRYVLSDGRATAWRRRAAARGPARGVQASARVSRRRDDLLGHLRRYVDDGVLDAALPTVAALAEEIGSDADTVGRDLGALIAGGAVALRRCSVSGGVVYQFADGARTVARPTKVGEVLPPPPGEMSPPGETPTSAADRFFRVVYRLYGESGRGLYASEPLAARRRVPPFRPGPTW